MKLMNKTLATLGLGLALALPALAGDGSFNTTNTLVNGVNFTLYPTNAPGTGTGSGIDLRTGYRTTGLYLSCDVSNAATAPIGISLVRSDKVTTAGITNWETTALYKFIISVPAMTNHFDWMTNLPDDFTSCAVKMGISQLTNNFASGNSVTNLDIGVIKKLTTIVYP